MMVFDTRTAKKAGRSHSRKKTEAARANGNLGGRPRTYPTRCPRYGAHRFDVSKSNPNRCPCGYVRDPRQ